MVASAEIRDLIQGMVEAVVRDYAPEKVILFGSFAHGTPHADSDIDLLIIKETPERLIDRWVTVRRILTDPKRLVPLEVLVLTPNEVSERLEAGDQFITQILEQGDVLYDSSGIMVSN